MAETNSGNAFWDSLDDLDRQESQRLNNKRILKEVHQLQGEANLSQESDIASLIAYHRGKTVVAMDDFYRAYLSKARAALNVALAGAKGNIALDEREIEGITAVLESLNKITERSK